MRLNTEIINCITNILTDLLGNAHPSLSLGQPRGRKGTCFFYRIPKKEPIFAMLEHLRTTYPIGVDFPLGGLSYPFYDEHTKNSKKDAYVRLVEREDHISLCFYPMEGVRFHTSYGKQIVSTIYTGKDSLLELLIDDDWNIWTRSKAGDKKLQFNWWLNKCLRENETIRSVVVAFLRQIGKKTPIFLDVARTVENDGYFFPPLDFDEIQECHTPTELIEKTGVLKIAVNYNKLDLNVGYYLSCLGEQFDQQEGIQLRDYPKKRLHSFVQPKDLYEGPNAERFLTMHYSHDFGAPEFRQLRQEVIDYLQMCLDHGLKPQILPSYNAFLRKHDEMANSYKRDRIEAEFQEPLIAEQSRFEKVDNVFRQYGMENYEWIKTVERLYEEGERQHNCVFVYRFSIREDLCAIFHMDRHGESYTIRIERNPKGRFYIAEMRGRCNRPYRQEDFDYVNEYLRHANRKEPEDIQFNWEREQPMNPFVDFLEVNDGDVPPLE